MRKRGFGSIWQIKSGKFRGYGYSSDGKRKFITANTMLEANQKIQRIALGK